MNTLLNSNNPAEINMLFKLWPFVESLHRDGFRQVAWLIDIGATQHGDVIRKQLQRNRIDDRLGQRTVVFRHVNDFHAVTRLDA